MAKAFAPIFGQNRVLCSSFIGAAPGYLSARTNLLKSSNNFTGTGWTPQTGLTTTPGQLAADGTMSASLITAVAGHAGSKNFEQNTFTAIAANAAGVSSIEAKAGTYSILTLWKDTVGSIAIFDVANGTVLSGAPNAKITPLPNGFYLCEVTRSTAEGWISVRYRMGNGDVSFTANGTETMFFANAQLEGATVATKRIVTTTAPVTAQPGGVLPVGWSWGAAPGLTREIVTAGERPDGTPFLRLRLNGKNTSAGTQYPDLYPVDQPSSPTVTLGETWTASVALTHVAGSQSTGFVNPSRRVNIMEAGAAHSYLTGTAAVTAMDGSRTTATRTFTSPSIVFTKFYLDLAFGAGTSVDWTFEIEAPQLEKAPAAGPYVATYGAAIVLPVPQLFAPVATARGAWGGVPGFAFASFPPTIASPPAVIAHVFRIAAAGQSAPRARSFDGAGPGSTLFSGGDGIRDRKRTRRFGGTGRKSF